MVKKVKSSDNSQLNKDTEKITESMKNSELKIVKIPCRLGFYMVEMVDFRFDLAGLRVLGKTRN